MTTQRPPLSTETRRLRQRASLILTLLVLFLAGSAAYAIAFYQGIVDDPTAAQGAATLQEPKNKPAEKLPAPSEVTVNVYNASDRQGLAGETAKQLETLKFEVAEVANAPRMERLDGEGEIRHGEEGKKQAQALAKVAPGLKLKQDRRTSSTVDILLGQKFTEISEDSSGAKNSG